MALCDRALKTLQNQLTGHRREERKVHGRQLKIDDLPLSQGSVESNVRRFSIEDAAYSRSSEVAQRGVETAQNLSALRRLHSLQVLNAVPDCPSWQHAEGCA